MKKLRVIIFLMATVCAFHGKAISASPVDPMATNYTYKECEGSLTPYVAPSQHYAVPEGMTAVMINHVGRHGSRYPASATNCELLLKALQRAEKAQSITTLGRELMCVTQRAIDLSQGRWGALDSLGEIEQRGIASRMYANFPTVMDGARVKAISSYSPRCMMSMYAFNHQLDRLNNRMEFATSTGRQNSRLLRPFDVDADYIEFRKSAELTDTYQAYFQQHCPTGAIERVLGASFPYESDEEKLNLAITEYYVVAGFAAMSIDVDASRFFTREQYNALWSCFNLRQYLQRTATTLSQVPADIAAPLLSDLITTTQAYIDGEREHNVLLRFGHAETLMPLLSLMRLRGCYYMTNYFDTVGLHWQDYHVVPMAANLQMILFVDDAGKYYVRVDLNEVPVSLLPNSDEVYVPWDEARAYLERCLPL